MGNSRFLAPPSRLALSPRLGALLEDESCSNFQALRLNGNYANYPQAFSCRERGCEIGTGIFYNLLILPGEWRRTKGKKETFAKEECEQKKKRRDEVGNKHSISGPRGEQSLTAMSFVLKIFKLLLWFFSLFFVCVFVFIDIVIDFMRFICYSWGSSKFIL